MAAEPQARWSRWLPTVLGGALALGTVAFYELGGSSAPNPDACPPTAREPDAPNETASDGEPSKIRNPGARTHPATAREAQSAEERVVSLEAQNQLLAERSVTGDLGYYGHSQSELEAMARHCDVRMDYPTRLNPEQAEDLGMSPDEQEAYLAALTKFAEADNALYRSLYTELYPEAAEVEAMSMRDVRKGITRQLGRVPKQDHVELRRSIAEERAGLREPPPEDELGTFERYNRARFGSGDRFATFLEAELGPERVDELRRAFEGWPGARTREWGCDDSEGGSPTR